MFSSSPHPELTPSMSRRPTNPTPPAVPLSPLSTASLPTSTLSSASLSSTSPSSPKRSRSRSHALSLEVLIEDLVDHNASASRTSPLLASPLPSPSALLTAHLPDAALVTSAYYIASLDARVPVNHDNASALLVACLGAAAPDATAAIASAAGIGCAEVREYAEIACTYVPRPPEQGDCSTYDELLRGMVEGLVD